MRKAQACKMLVGEDGTPRGMIEGHRLGNVRTPHGTMRVVRYVPEPETNVMMVIADEMRALKKLAGPGSIYRTPLGEAYGALRRLQKRLMRRARWSMVSASKRGRPAVVIEDNGFLREEKDASKDNGGDDTNRDRRGRENHQDNGNHHAHDRR